MMKVINTIDEQKQISPAIKLQGEILREFKFNPGDDIEVYWFFGVIQIRNLTYLNEQRTTDNQAKPSQANESYF